MFFTERDQKEYYFQLLILPV